MNSGRTSLNQLQNSFVFIRFFFLFLIWIRTLFKKNQTKTNFKTMDQARKILPFKHAVVDVNQNMAFDLFIFFCPFGFSWWIFIVGDEDGAWWRRTSLLVYGDERPSSASNMMQRDVLVCASKRERVSSLYVIQAICISCHRWWRQSSPPLITSKIANTMSFPPLSIGFVGSLSRISSQMRNFLCVGYKWSNSLFEHPINLSVH